MNWVDFVALALPPFCLTVGWLLGRREERIGRRTWTRWN